MLKKDIFVFSEQIIKDIEDNQIVMGYPAVPLRDFLKNKKWVRSK